MRKRGISHIEIILSFIIFVGAIAFALYFFNPADSDRLIDTSLNYGFREIIEYTEVEVQTFSVDIDGTGIDDDEIDIGSNIDAVPVNISGVNSNYGTRVERYEGSVLSAIRGGDFVHIQRPGSGWQTIDFVSISYSDEFSLGSGVTGAHEEKYYRLASSTSKKVLGERLFLELVQQYVANYTILKEEFNIPPRVNFGFSLEYSNGTIKAERQIPEGLEVFSEKKRVE